MSVDGEPIDMERLDQMLLAAKEANRVVWYYREAGSGDPPSQAMAAIQLIVKHKLRISMSSKPDFSDYVDAKGVSHPRTDSAKKPAAPDGPAPQMPDVETGHDLAQVFAEARKLAASEQGRRGLVIVRPDRKSMVLPALAESPALKNLAQQMGRVVPPNPPRNIAVIACTGFAAGSAVPGVMEAGQAIPFLGMLIGLSYIGHAVWIFEGHPSAIAQGCRDADVLLVDSGMLPLLQPGWQDSAIPVMRNANILVHDRSTFQLRIAHKVGKSADRLEFLA